MQVHLIHCLMVGWGWVMGRAPTWSWCGAGGGAVVQFWRAGIDPHNKQPERLFLRVQWLQIFFRRLLLTATMLQNTLGINPSEFNDLSAVVIWHWAVITMSNTCCPATHFHALTLQYRKWKYRWQTGIMQCFADHNHWRCCTIFWTWKVRQRKKAHAVRVFLILQTGSLLQKDGRIFSKNAGARRGLWELSSKQVGDESSYIWEGDDWWG